MPLDPGEDAPELTLVDGFVIGVVCLFGGTAAVLGLGAVATAIVTLDRAHAPGMLGLTFGAIFCGITAIATYFLAGGADGAVRGHEPFESVLYWTSAAALAGLALAVLGVAIRTLFW